MLNSASSLLALMTILVITSAWAEPAIRKDVQPSTDLLEFLGQMIEIEDELIGPEIFNDDEDNIQANAPDEVPAATQDKTPDKGDLKND